LGGKEAQWGGKKRINQLLGTKGTAGLGPNTGVKWEKLGKKGWL